MNLPHVFAKATVITHDLGYQIRVAGGTCWLADDPLVKARPDLFSEDCRYAVGRDSSWSGEPPACMAVPPEDEFSSVAMTAGVRAKSRAERARAGNGG